MSPFDSKDFQRLKRKWYRRLESAGFEEIEDTESPREWLKRWDSYYFAVRNEEVRASKAEYISLATDLLHAHAFNDPTDREIWRLHCEGLSIRKIMKRLRITNHRAFQATKRLRKIIMGGR